MTTDDHLLEIVVSNRLAITVLAAWVLVADIGKLLLAVTSSLSFRTRALVSGQQAQALSTIARIWLAMVDRAFAQWTSEAEWTRTVDSGSIWTGAQAFAAILALVLELWKRKTAQQDDLDHSNSPVTAQLTFAS